MGGRGEDRGHQGGLTRDARDGWAPRLQNLNAVRQLACRAAHRTYFGSGASGSGMPAGSGVWSTLSRKDTRE